jgi:hypothetical protein
MTELYRIAKYLRRKLRNTTVDNEEGSIAKFTPKALFTEETTTSAIFINQSLILYGVTSLHQTRRYRALNQFINSPEAVPLTAVLKSGL